MNEIHRIDLPRAVFIGKGVLNLVGKVCQEFAFQRILLITGRTTYTVAGKTILGILAQAGLEAEAVQVNRADMETVYKVEEGATKFRADALMGVGGGRTIDVAKLGSSRVGRPFLSVPTAASHDGIASSSASVKGIGRPYSIKAKVPIAVIADSKIIADSPHRFTASGCGDVISKAIAVRDWRLAHKEKGEYYGEYAGSLALMSSNLVMESACQIRDRHEVGYRTLLEALVSCGVAMSIAGSSRPCSGSEHLFSHALDMLAPGIALHGEQCGVGTIMMAKLYGLNWRSIKENLSVIGAPTTAEELGIDPEIIVKALVRAKDIRPERHTILNNVNLGTQSAKDLAQCCGVM